MIEDEPVLCDHDDIQVVHLVSKFMQGETSRPPNRRGIIFWSKTCCGKSVNDITIFRQTHCIELTTCEECRRGYGIELLAELP